ncbi:MacS family sensor histidine kinase [Polymorphospora rubra]|uniref:Histidine kinase n=1 Tax=Polymorphospora rubra TaxID=338584 RepID=A0A810MZC8_9ACTN|nr:DUF5931 domain-containing protein [Polymorphospora rubra]BCJ66516.1 histidine kinase [Polymorphospora rubra]
MTTVGPGGLQQPMWRAIAVFRFAALAYVLAIVARDVRDYARPLAVLPVLAVLIGWTVATAYAYARPAWRRWPLLGADLLISVAVLVVTPWVVGRAALNDGAPTLGVAWQAGPVLTWAVSGGRRRGVVAALVVGGADLAVRERLTQSSLTGTALMLLAALAVGHVVRLTSAAEERWQRAVALEAATREREAATRERERLARGIHDSVLQVLALVQRRGAHLDGEAGELARLAGEQETALRALIAREPSGDDDGQLLDLRPLVGRYTSPLVSVAAPATPVRLPAGAAREIGAAVGAALDNVERHCGPQARAWVLVEDEGGAVTVSVRDEGPGLPAGRLDEAAAQGRLGVAQSIRGRIADLGGTVTITSVVGEGTEVELTVPRLDG